MSLIKLGEAIVVTAANIQSADSVLADPEILSRFQKVAAELKSIAPKAKDFLYFSAIMMHSAEAALLNADGSIKKDAQDNDITVQWEKKGESWKWVCSDPSVRPYKNSNNDIFPEEELVKAHKKWVGRPLCLDHKSSSVDMIRGVIVDTYYDRPSKRVIALCALDKVNYPDLARKVSTGYATSVSMGTAVGRAICSDCQRVARVESEFCDCMRNKKCYGEINVDLNPIELSIVVNGADPKAKIRHIVAAADSLAQYIDSKQVQLNKLAHDETKDIELAGKIEQGLEKATEELTKLKDMVTELKGNEESEQKEYEAGDSEKAADEVKDDSDAQDSMYSKEAHAMLDGIKKSLDSLRKDFNNFAIKNIEDAQMTTKNAYYLGGGGVNEPTPGKPKYEKEDEDSIRNNEDKQMGGQMDTGPVDGMHPGYDSFGESEEARKKRLLRASDDNEESIRRQAALRRAKEALASKKSEAYMLGTEEPTPGKAQYAKEDAEKLREKEDKHMVGAPPFPGVGKPDGLYGDDEKQKKLLLRAKLTAKFIKAANSDGSENPSESRWQVYADDKIILTATVNDITGGRTDALYDSVATKDFGRKMLEKIRTVGFDKAASMFKAAQTAPMAPAAAPAPAPAAPLDMAPDMGAPAEPVDGGGDGNPKDEVKNSLDEVESGMAQLREGVEALLGESGNELEDLADMTAATDVEMPAAVAELLPLQKKLSAALVVGMKQAIKELSEHAEELRLAKHIYDNEKVLKKADLGYVNQLSKDACQDAKKTLADMAKVMEAFVKYARGTESLVKQATKEIGMKKFAEDPTAPVAGKVYDAGDPFMPLDAKPGVPYAPKQTAPKAAPAPMMKAPAAKPAAPAPKTGPGSLPPAYPRQSLETMLINNTRESATGGKFQTPQAPGASGQNADDGAADENDATMTKQDGTKIEFEGDELSKVLASAPDMTTKEGRAAARAKLAEKGMAFSDMLGKAHSGGVTTKLDTKPSGDLAKVETLEETHKAMMDLANAPPKVRKTAEDIQKLVVAGRIDPEKDFPGLISQGLDSDAVKYWKSFFTQAKDGGSQFASELVKEHQASKVAEEKETYRVKISRAYEVAYDMVRKGMIGNDRHAVNEQVNELMKFNDEGFSSMKRWVERQDAVKTASIPQVGLIGSGEVTLSSPEVAPTGLVNDLENAFRNRKY